MKAGSRAPCVVSDRVVYRTLLRSGFERFDAVERAVRLHAVRSRVFQEKVWKLMVRYQGMALDERLPCVLTGSDHVSYLRFCALVEERLPEVPIKGALVSLFPRKVRQLRQDLHGADDFDFFCCGGLNLRDEIELVRIYLERAFRSVHELGRYGRELEILDDRLRSRLAVFWKEDDAASYLGPEDGFRIGSGILPQRFWWRHFAPGE